ncbi:hypothetical protein VMCG_09951 [Cytospora schulzeri]|uniref:Protein kinase domain-containing protein n=1 Tax=Cytospora schulzeri TaxID=448051 RepID=A0A423VF06_9PEZI|nr:hypothetical protein VMCG_09951 [Valsa malicola]
MSSTIPDQDPTHLNGISAQVILKLNRTGECVAISLFQSSTAKELGAKKVDLKDLPVVDRSIRLLAQSLYADDYDEQQALEDEAMDPMMSTTQLILLSWNLRHMHRMRLTTRSRTRVCITFCFRRHPTTDWQEATTEGPVLVSIPADEAYGIDFENDITMQDHPAEMDIDYTLPQYSSEEIQVIKEFLFGGAVKVPLLLGYVVHPKFGVILGLLREWIPSKDSLRDLEQDIFPGITKETRMKWARQIQETIKSLHAIGVILGDAKPGNIVIDLNGDAWLIDFEGGRSEGWVDKDLEETVDGDQVAVGRILKFLDIDV